MALIPEWLKMAHMEENGLNGWNSLNMDIWFSNNLGFTAQPHLSGQWTLELFAISGRLEAPCQTNAPVDKTVSRMIIDREWFFGSQELFFYQ